jgi:5-hydroxyisourate hydrolase-like protein (transthyretin family)
MIKKVRAALLAATMTGVAGAGCVNQQPVAYIEVPSTLPLLPTVPTTRNAQALKQQIPPVGGVSTTTTIAFAKGTVTLSGVVRGPDGEPVPDAVVVLTRVLGDQRAVLRVQTNEDGRYVAGNVKGGVVELYAFKPPELSAGDAKVVFATGKTTQDLTLGDFSDLEIRWSVGPGQPTIGRVINLTIQLNVRRVDPDGVVRPAPLEGISARIVALGALQPTGETERVTDALGLASFTMICNGSGSASVQAYFATGEDTVIEPRGCQPPPTTAPPDTTGPARTNPPGAGPAAATVPSTQVSDAPAVTIPVIPVIP